VVSRVENGVAAGLGYEEIAVNTTLANLLADLYPSRPRELEILERLGPMIEDAAGRAYLEASGRLDE